MPYGTDGYAGTPYGGAASTPTTPDALNSAIANHEHFLAGTLALVTALNQPTAEHEHTLSATLTAQAGVGPATTNHEHVLSATLSVPFVLPGTPTNALQLAHEHALTAILDLDVAVVAPPTGLDVVYIQRTSPVMPTPTLTNGQPQNWAPTSVTGPEDWFRFQIVIGGVDVTYFRNVEAEVQNCDYSEPFSEEQALIRFPQITPFETPGSGSLSWLKPGEDVTLNRVYTDGTRKRHFEGLLISHEPHHDEKTGYWDVHVLGIIRHAQFGVQQVPSYLDARDYGVRAPSALNDMDGRRYAWCRTVTTGQTTRFRGSMTQNRLQIAQELLANTTTTDGSNSWTILNAGYRVPVMALKDITTHHWTLTTGTQGMACQLSYDYTARRNRIYGSGTRPDGGFWANYNYAVPADVYAVTVDPLAEDANAASELAIEGYTAYGEGITKAQGVAAAQAELRRFPDPGWAGTITLRIDPEEGSRWEIREGQNVYLKSWAGGNFLLHVNRVSQDFANMTVTLTVDQYARDLENLAAIYQRDQEAKQSIVGHAREQRRRSKTVPDSTTPWDSEAGAGVVPSTSCPANQWTRIRVPFGQAGDIVDGLLSTSPAVAFAAALWDNEISLSWLTGFGDPLTTTSIWDTNWNTLDDAGWIEGWGDSTQAAGYSDSTTTPASLTGKLRTSGFPFDSTIPPWVWLTIWPAQDTTISGTFTAAPPQV